jgi:ABC-type glycerol-3-phosphate transport system substrate-binding protein
VGHRQCADDPYGWLGDDWWLTLVNARTGPAALTPVLRVSDRFTFAAPPFRWAAATLQDWAQRGLFTSHFGGLDAQDSVAAFFAGKTAMQLVSSTQNAHILSLTRATGLSVGIFPFPSVTPGRPPVMPQSGYAGWAVPCTAQHPAAALAFIDHVLSTRTVELLLSRGMVPAHRIEPKAALLAAPFQREYLDAVASALPGVYLDGAPVPNLNVTMEANIQLLLQGVETPDFLVQSLQAVYSSRGARATQTRTDGEF